jgi:hypothetical protein
MYFIEETSRVALVPAAGSTTKTVTHGNYTTIWNYREGYIGTTDPEIARKIAVGALWFGAGIGLIALVRALRD